MAQVYHALLVRGADPPNPRVLGGPIPPDSRGTPSAPFGDPFARTVD